MFIKNVLIVPVKFNLHWNLKINRHCDIVEYMQNPFVVLALWNTRKCIREYEDERYNTHHLIIMGWLICKFGSGRLLIVEVYGKIMLFEGGV
jgi:hypothetical protein